MLEQMGIFDLIPDSSTVHHLKPKVSRDWISAVERRLKASHFGFSGTDPDDSLYDEFSTQARAIQSSSLIVGSLLGTNIDNYQEHNANVALLVGFAIGLGKEIMVLQAEPRASILDLGNLSHIFTAETHATRLVNRWLETQTRAAIHQRVESRQRAVVRGRIDQIRRIYLGHPDALQDTSLSDYFVPTTEYEDAIEGRRMIFVGRRGTGKSANFKALSENLGTRPDTIVVEIAPDDYELHRITDYLGSHHQDPSSAYLYQPVWHYVLITEMVKALAENTDTLFWSQTDQDAYNLRQYYESNRPALHMDFGSRVTQALMEIFESAENAPSASKHEPTQRAINELNNYHISRRLRDFVSRQNLKFFLVSR